MFESNLATMELTLAHFAMAGASRKNSDFNFAAFASVYQIASAQVEEFSFVIGGPICVECSRGLGCDPRGKLAVAI